MHSDSLVVLREEGFRGAYWSEPRFLENQQLHFIHILPSIILCVGGLGISTIIFTMEVVYHKWTIHKNRNGSRAGGIHEVMIPYFLTFYLYLSHTLLFSYKGHRET